MTLLALLLAAAAGAPPMPVGGRTKAPDAKVAGAALEEARGFAARSLKCGDAGSATASLMPKGWAPADPNFRIGPKGARYERWEIALCGRSEPFLVVFWKDKGRADFQVAHPFPEGPAERAKRR